MRKKYTMQDIAREANVSKATVSYVLNDKKEARISEQTRRKILHLANLYHYVPNLSAKYLGDTHKKLIGAIVGDNGLIDFDGGFRIFDMLCSLFPASDYKIVLLDSKKHYDYIDLAYDIIFAKDLNETQIRDLSKNTFSPVILLDCVYADPMFFQIVNDYAAAVKCAVSKFADSRECVLLYIAKSSECVSEILRKPNVAGEFAFNGKNRGEAEEFLKKNDDKNIIAIGEAAGLIALSVCPAGRLSVILKSDSGFFPEAVKKVFWDEKLRRKYVSLLVPKLMAREAKDSDQHVLYVGPAI